MIVSSDCNFVFLEEAYPYLAHNACIAESCVYTDPHNCIMKIGLLNEELCRLICAKCGIEIDRKAKFEQVVHKLKKGFFKDRDVSTYLKIEEVKKSRNMAAHNLPRTDDERRRYVTIAANALIAGYAISVNFYSYFVNPDYQFPVFRMSCEPGEQISGERDAPLADEYSACHMLKPVWKRELTQIKEFLVPKGGARKERVLFPPGLSACSFVGAIQKTGAIVSGSGSGLKCAAKSRGIAPDSVNDFFDSLNLSELDNAKD